MTTNIISRISAFIEALLEGGPLIDKIESAFIAFAIFYFIGQIIRSTL